MNSKILTLQLAVGKFAPIQAGGQSMRQKKYKAFISYSHKDAKISKWLHRKLESYKVPKHLVGLSTEHGKIPAKLFPIFRDRDDLAATTHMTDSILEAIRESEFLIVICTPASAQSKLVNREIQEFKKLNGSENILCLIAGGVPFSQNPDEECFSELLQRHIAPDGTPADYAPEGLAADIRPGSDGKQAAISKLVAGMLGVQLNILVRREMQQQKRKLVGALTGAFIVLAIVTTLLFQTIEAHQAAEQRSNDAADLLAYLHETVFEALDAAGNTDAQEKLIRSVFEHYETLDFKNADTLFLFHWSGGALRLGQNLERQGKNMEAARLFEQIRDFGTQFAKDHPKYTGARFRQQNSEFFYGYLKLRTGAYEEAEKSFRSRLATNMHALTDPNLTDESGDLIIDWYSTLADSQSLLGKTLAGPQDKTAEAETLIKAAIQNRIIALENYDPTANRHARNNKGLKIALTSTYLFMGNLYHRLGKLDEARRYYQKRIDILSELQNEAPDDLNVKRRKSIAKLALAKTQLDRGEIARAMTKTRQEVATFNSLTEVNPSSVLWFSGLVEAQNQLADICVSFDTCTDVDFQLDEALRLSGILFMRDDDRPHYRLTNYRAKMLKAQHMWRSGDHANARTELDALIEILSAEEVSFLRTDGAMEIAARIYLLASKIADQDGNMATATDFAQEVVRIVDARPNPWPEAQAYQAMALDYLGDMDRVEEVRSILGSIGYDYSAQLSALSSQASQHHVIAN